MAHFELFDLLAITDKVLVNPKVNDSSNIMGHITIKYQNVFHGWIYIEILVIKNGTDPILFNFSQKSTMSQITRFVLPRPLENTMVNNKNVR